MFGSTGVSAVRNFCFGYFVWRSKAQACKRSQFSLLLKIKNYCWYACWTKIWQLWRFAAASHIVDLYRYHPAQTKWKILVRQLTQWSSPWFSRYGWMTSEFILSNSSKINKLRGQIVQFQYWSIFENYPCISKLFYVEKMKSANK